MFMIYQPLLDYIDYMYIKFSHFWLNTNGPYNSSLDAANAMWRHKTWPTEFS